METRSKLYPLIFLTTASICWPRGAPRRGHACCGGGKRTSHWHSTQMCLETPIDRVRERTDTLVCSENAWFRNVDVCTLSHRHTAFVFFFLFSQYGTRRSILWTVRWFAAVAMASSSSFASKITCSGHRQTVWCEPQRSFIACPVSCIAMGNSRSGCSRCVLVSG